MSKKVVVIGLDGGTFKILKPLAEKGLMPNFKRLLEKGAHGILESTMPPMTATSWSSFATGKHPGSHGVYDFLIAGESLNDFHVTTSRDIKGRTLSEILVQNEKIPVTLNLPNSWPPRLDKEKYIMIGDLLTQGDQWIYPKNLPEEFPELKKYKLTPDESVRAANRREAYAKDIVQLEKDHFSAVKRIFEEKPWDFFFYLFSATDWIQHANFHDLMEGTAFDAAYDVYRVVDEYLGWYMDHLPPETNLLVVSDHGFKVYHKMFYFNKWLEREGYLATKAGTKNWEESVTRRSKEIGKVQKKVVLPGWIFKLMEKMPWLQPFAYAFYRKVVKRFFKMRVRVNMSVDYSKSKVCFPKGTYMTNAYINDARRYKNGVVQTEKEYQTIVQEIISKMKALRDPDGEPVVADVYTKEQIYGKNAPDRAPDIFFELADYWLNGQFHSGDVFVKNFVNNKHDKYGIFLAWGKDIQPGKIPSKNMHDVMPTILTLMDLPLPKDLDGKVIQEIFQHAPNIKTESEKQEIKNILSRIEI